LEVFEIFVVEYMGKKAHALMEIEFGTVSFTGSYTAALLPSANYRCPLSQVIQFIKLTAKIHADNSPMIQILHFHTLII